MNIPTELTNHNACVPRHATAGAAAADLCSMEHWSIPAGGVQLIKTGLKMEIPPGYAGMVLSRSGLAAKNGVFVLNSPGIIDSDYRGEIGVVIANFGKDWFSVSPGDRIAQFMIFKVEPVSYIESTVANNTERGIGGFGSTGVEARLTKPVDQHAVFGAYPPEGGREAFVPLPDGRRIPVTLSEGFFAPSAGKD